MIWKPSLALVRSSGHYCGHYVVDIETCARDACKGLTIQWHVNNKNLSIKTVVTRLEDITRHISGCHAISEFTLVIGWGLIDKLITHSLWAWSCFGHVTSHLLGPVLAPVEKSIPYGDMWNLDTKKYQHVPWMPITHLSYLNFVPPSWMWHQEMWCAQNHLINTVVKSETII